MENGMVRKIGGLLCEIWSEPAQGKLLGDVRIELAEEGIVLTEGIGRQPGGDAPAAELSGWKSGRLLHLGFNAEESLRGGHDLLEQVSRFANIGASRSCIVHFLQESDLEVYCSNGVLVYFIAGCESEEKEDTACAVVAANTPRTLTLKCGDAICLASENVRTSVPLARMKEICGNRNEIIADTHDPDFHSANSARKIAQIVRCYGETGSIAVAVITRICGQTSPVDTSKDGLQ